MVKAVDFDSVIAGSIPATPATNRGRKAQHIMDNFLWRYFGLHR